MPPKQREAIAEEHDYDYKARKLRFEKHLRAWVLFLITDDESLRDMHSAMNQDPLYELAGAGVDIGLGGLSQAHASRPYEAVLDVLTVALAQIQRIPKSKRALRTFSPQTLCQIGDLLSRVVLFDSTTLELPSQIKEWAEKEHENGLPLKVHLRLNTGYGGIDRILLTPEHENDALRYEELLDLENAPDASTIYLHDCGYRRLTTYDAVVDSGNHFVTRLHSQISVQTVRELALPEERELPNGYTLIRDRLVTLGADPERERRVYRAINCLDSKGNPVVIVTSLVETPVEDVCFLYFYRWTIEILFRWLKHALGLAHLISHSPNGIMMQVVATLLVYALLILYHQDGPLSLKRLLRELRYQIHERLYQIGYEQGVRDTMAQLAAGVS